MVMTDNDSTTGGTVSMILQEEVTPWMRNMALVVLLASPIGLYYSVHHVLFDPEIVIRVWSVVGAIAWIITIYVCLYILEIIPGGE